jgi:hypothetical protein
LTGAQLDTLTDEGCENASVPSNSDTIAAASSVQMTMPLNCWRKTPQGGVGAPAANG